MINLQNCSQMLKEYVGKVDLLMSERKEQQKEKEEAHQVRDCLCLEHTRWLSWVAPPVCILDVGLDYSLTRFVCCRLNGTRRLSGMRMQR